MSIKIKEKKEYIESLDARMYLTGIPYNGQIDLTYDCNLKCKHCFIYKESDKEELKLSQTFSIIDEIHEAGCLWLCFSGGEPFLREDFLDIYLYARKKGFLVTIFTNGTLITRRIAEYLGKFPPHSIEITLNGMTQKVYETVTQIEGSYAKVMENIKVLKKFGLPLTIKCNGMNINRGEILKIKEFSENLLGKKHFRCDLVLYPGMDGSKKPLEFRLTPDEILNIQYSDEDMVSLCMEERLNHKDNHRLKRGYLFPCGLDYFNIDPYGQMRICSFVREPHADLRKERFLDGFRNLRAYLSDLRAGVNNECYGCQIRRLCRQCPGRALAENGNMNMPVKYFCELAHKEEKKEIKEFNLC